MEQAPSERRLGAQRLETEARADAILNELSDAELDAFADIVVGILVSAMRTPADRTRDPRVTDVA